MPHDDADKAAVSGRKYPAVDVLVHEFCKLFGKNGVPEYTCGVISFPDFLDLMISDDSLHGDKDQALLSFVLIHHFGSSSWKYTGELRPGSTNLHLKNNAHLNYCHFVL